MHDHIELYNDHQIKTGGYCIINVVIIHHFCYHAITFAKSLAKNFHILHMFTYFSSIK